MKGQSCILVILFYISTGSTSVDFFWRDYDGEIPIDAVPGGYDVNRNEYFYIAQALAYKNNVYGLFPTTIRLGDKKAKIPLWGTTEVSHLKILCSTRIEEFSWVKTTQTTFTDDVWKKHKKPVPGGWEFFTNQAFNTRLYIGRFNSTIGKVLDTSPVIRYALDTVSDEEPLATSYEVLVYGTNNLEMVFV